MGDHCVENKAVRPGESQQERERERERESERADKQLHKGTHKKGSTNKTDKRNAGSKTEAGTRWGQSGEAAKPTSRRPVRQPIVSCPARARAASCF